MAYTVRTDGSLAGGDSLVGLDTGDASGNTGKKPLEGADHGLTVGHVDRLMAPVRDLRGRVAGLEKREIPLIYIDREAAATAAGLDSTDSSDITTPSEIRDVPMARGLTKPGSGLTIGVATDEEALAYMAKAATDTSEQVVYPDKQGVTFGCFLTFDERGAIVPANARYNIWEAEADDPNAAIGMLAADDASNPAIPSKTPTFKAVRARDGLWIRNDGLLIRTRGTLVAGEMGEADTWVTDVDRYVTGTEAESLDAMLANGLREYANRIYQRKYPEVYATPSMTPVGGYFMIPSKRNFQVRLEDDADGKARYEDCGLIQGLTELDEHGEVVACDQIYLMHCLDGVTRPAMMDKTMSDNHWYMDYMRSRSEANREISDNYIEIRVGESALSTITITNRYPKALTGYLGQHKWLIVNMRYNEALDDCIGQRLRIEMEDEMGIPVRKWLYPDYCDSSGNIFCQDFWHEEMETWVKPLFKKIGSEYELRYEPRSINVWKLLDGIEGVHTDCLASATGGEASQSHIKDSFAGVPPDTVTGDNVPDIVMDLLKRADEIVFESKNPERKLKIRMGAPRSKTDGTGWVRASEPITICLSDDSPDQYEVWTVIMSGTMFGDSSIIAFRWKKIR